MHARQFSSPQNIQYLTDVKLNEVLTDALSRAKEPAVSTYVKEIRVYVTVPEGYQIQEEDTSLQFLSKEFVNYSYDKKIHQLKYKLVWNTEALQKNIRDVYNITDHYMTLLLCDAVDQSSNGEFLIDAKKFELFIDNFLEKFNIEVADREALQLPEKLLELAKKGVYEPPRVRRII